MNKYIIVYEYLNHLIIYLYQPANQICTHSNSYVFITEGRTNGLTDTDGRSIK